MGGLDTAREVVGREVVGKEVEREVGREVRSKGALTGALTGLGLEGDMLVLVSISEVGKV